MSGKLARMAAELRVLMAARRNGRRLGIAEGLYESAAVADRRAYLESVLHPDHHRAPVSA